MGIAGRDRQETATLPEVLTARIYTRQQSPLVLLPAVLKDLLTGPTERDPLTPTCLHFETKVLPSSQRVYVMPYEFEFLVAVAFRGWFAAAIIAGATTLALAVTIRVRAVLGQYFVVALCILAAQIAWALFAMVSTAENPISRAACLSGIWGMIALPSASIIDLTALSVTAYRKRLSRAIWVKLARAKLLFGFVVFCAVLRSTSLCTV